MWIGLGLLSALCLGLYDVAKKHALRDNAVLPVLFAAVIIGALSTLPLVITGWWWPDAVRGTWFAYPPLPETAIWHALAKAVLVAASWICAYFSLKNLPITLVSPIRASGPLLVVFGAFFLFAEIPGPLQWLGLGILLIGYVAFSLLGRKEGIVLHRSGWIWIMVLATALGSLSSLYDKWLIVKLGCHPLSLQIAFAWWLVPVLALVVGVLWWPQRHKHQRATWRWSLLAVGMLLMLADFLYFRALTEPDALVGVLSALRRSSVVISLIVGGIVFREERTRNKLIALVFVLMGVILIAAAS